MVKMGGQAFYMSKLRKIKMGRKGTEKTGEIKEVQKSQCVASYSPLLSDPLWWKYVPRTERQRQALTLHSTSNDSLYTQKKVHSFKFTSFERAHIQMQKDNHHFLFEGNSAIFPKFNIPNSLQ